MVRKLIVLCAVLTMLQACSTVTGIFKSDKEKAFSYIDVKDFIQKPVSVQLLKDFLIQHKLLEE